MAFPSIASSTTADAGTNVTTLDVAYPASIAAGDLLLLYVSFDGAGDSASAPGFTELGNARHSVLADNGAGYVFTRDADGTETGSVTVTITGGIEHMVGAMLRIPAASWYGTVAGGVEIATFGNTGASDATAEVPSLTPSWGSADTLWIASATWDGNPTYVSSPTNYTHVADVDPGVSTGASLAIAYRQNATATEDPDQFTLSASEQWAAFLVAVRPAAGGGAAQNVGMDHLAGTSINNPTVVPGTATVGMDHLAGTVLNQPTVAAGSVAVGMEHLAGTVLHEPTVSESDTQLVGMDHLAGTVLHGPTVAPGAVSVGMVAIATTVLNDPTVTPGEALVGMTHLAGTSLNEPGVSPGAVSVGMDHLSGTTLNAPTVAQVVGMNHLSGTSLNSPGVTMKVGMAHLATTTLNNPAIPVPVAVLDTGLAAPRYRIQVWDMSGAELSAGNLIAEFQNAGNLGYAEYLNDVGEAFFTILQDDPKIELLRDHKNKAHVKIYRNNDLVWAGFLGEWEANERDAIIYAYGYAGLYYFVTSDWNVAYSSTQLDTIVTDAFNRAQTGVSNSLARWVAMGDIEAPVTTSGGSTAIVLPSYRMFYKRILFVFQEMAALAVGETTNVVQFEVTPEGVFNFWKNAGTDTNEIWEYGSGVVKGFNEANVPILRRNDILGVGINPNDITLRDEETDSADITANGRRMEPMFFSWVRDSTELDRVLKGRLARAKRDLVDMNVEFYPNRIIPPRATGATWGLADRVRVKVERGLTSVNKMQLVSGYQVVYSRGTERVRAIVQDRPNA